MKREMGRSDAEPLAVDDRVSFENGLVRQMATVINAGDGKTVRVCFDKDPQGVFGGPGRRFWLFAWRLKPEAS